MPKKQLYRRSSNSSSDCTIPDWVFEPSVKKTYNNGIEQPTAKQAIAKQAIDRPILDGKQTQLPRRCQHPLTSSSNGQPGKTEENTNAGADDDRKPEWNKEAAKQNQNIIKNNHEKMNKKKQQMSTLLFDEDNDDNDKEEVTHQNNLGSKGSTTNSDHDTEYYVSLLFDDDDDDDGELSNVPTTIIYGDDVDEEFRIFDNSEEVSELSELSEFSNQRTTATEYSKDTEYYVSLLFDDDSDAEWERWNVPSTIIYGDVDDVFSNLDNESGDGTQTVEESVGPVTFVSPGKVPRYPAMRVRTYPTDDAENE